MLFKIIPPIFFLFYCFPTSAQNIVTDTSASCVAYWNKGDVKELEITRIKQKLEAGKQKDLSKETYGATIKVLDATDTSYTIEWKYKAPDALQDDSPVAKLYNLVLDLKIIYTTDETGIFDSLNNYDEIKIFFDNSIALLGEQAADKEKFKKVATQMKSIFSNKENLAHLVLREIMLYHSPYGVEYFSNHVQEYQTLLPNVFGGDPFPATIELKMLKRDTEKDLAQFSIKQQIDKEKAAGILAAIIKKLTTDKQKKSGNEEEINKITINDISRFDVQLSSGWIEALTFKREVTIGSSQNIETCEMKVK